MFQPADRRLIVGLGIYLDAINRENGTSFRWEWTGTGLTPMIKVFDVLPESDRLLAQGPLDVIVDAIKDGLEEYDLKDPT